MMLGVAKALFWLAPLASVKAYWLMGAGDFITTERLDPLVSPGKVSGHVHSVLGGSNFRATVNTAQLRQSQCTSIPIAEDKSSYWFPHLFFQWGNGSFSSLNGGAVIYYLFSDPAGSTKAFPDDFRMLSGDPTLRTYDPTSYAQQAITFLCLDFSGTSTRFNEIPAQICPDGVRAQINFPSCWDGKNLDSSDHKSHVAFLSGGPDSGSCSDPNFPVTLPRIFMEVYWATGDFDNFRSQAMNSSQPFVYSYGDPTGYGYHADFINGWDEGALQKAVDNCNCNEYGDPTCCGQQGIFTYNPGQQCRITNVVNEQTTGTLPKLPGNNPVVKEGHTAPLLPDSNPPSFLSPVYAYTGNTPPGVGTPVSQPPSPPNSVSPSSAAPSSSVPPKSGSSVLPPNSSSPAGIHSSSSPQAAPSTTIDQSPSSSVFASPHPPTSGPTSSKAPQPPASSASPGMPQNSSQPSQPVAPPVSSPHSLIAAPSSTPSSDEGDDGDCDDEGGNEAGSTPSSVLQPPASSPLPAPQTHSSQPSHSAAPPAHSSNAAAPAPTSSNEEDDNCDDEDGDETSGSGPGSSPDTNNSNPSNPVPVTTLGFPSSPVPSNVLSPVPSSVPDVCPGGPFRHKKLKAQLQAREMGHPSVHKARAFHSRFMKPHAHVF